MIKSLPHVDEVGKIAKIHDLRSQSNTVRSVVRSAVQYGKGSRTGDFGGGGQRRMKDNWFSKGLIFEKEKQLFCSLSRANIKRALNCHVNKPVC